MITFPLLPLPSCISLSAIHNPPLSLFQLSSHFFGFYDSHLISGSRLEAFTRTRFSHRITCFLQQPPPANVSPPRSFRNHLFAASGSKSTTSLLIFLFPSPPPSPLLLPLSKDTANDDTSNSRAQSDSTRSLVFLSLSLSHALSPSLTGQTR